MRAGEEKEKNIYLEERSGNCEESGRERDIAMSSEELLSKGIRY